MYPVYCIAPTGRTSYITEPISLEDKNCERYLLCWEICLQTCNTFISFNRFIFLNVYIPTREFSFCSISTMCINTIFHFVSWFFGFMDGCLWWIPFINIWWNLLRHNRRYIFDMIIYPNPKAHQRILLKPFGYVTNVTQLSYQKNVMDTDRKTNIIRGI